MEAPRQPPLRAGAPGGKPPVAPAAVAPNWPRIGPESARPAGSPQRGSVRECL